MKTAVAAVVLALAAGPAAAGSLDLALRGYGLSIGDSRRITGLRINLVDRDLEQVNGLNLTLWKARRNPAAIVRGGAIGLVGPYAGRIDGLSVGLLYTITESDMNGIAFGGLGVDAGGGINGLAVGLGGAVAIEDVRGITVAGVRAGARQDLTGARVATSAASPSVGWGSVPVTA